MLPREPLLSYVFWQSERKMVVTAKNVVSRFQKPPKKLHSPNTAANRRGRSHEGNSESAPSLPLCLSLSLGKLSYVRSYDKCANSEAAVCALCVVPFVKSLHPFLKPNSPNTEARSKKRSSPTDTISFQNIHFPLHSRRRETGELCSK